MSLLAELTQKMMIKSLIIDSRQAGPGSVFLAYPGSAADGRDFIADAIKNGASAVVYEPAGFQPKPVSVPMIPVRGLREQVNALAAEFYGFPGNQLTIIGITGTNGKSSVCHFTAQALTKLGQRCGVISTVGNGIWPQLSTSERTTPDPIALQRYLADFVKDGVTHVVIEVSSHALDQQRVHLPDFDIAVFTNLSRDHLDYHPSMQAYAAAKARLFTAPNLTAAVVNRQAEFAKAMVAHLPAGAKLRWYQADQSIKTRLLGRFNQENVAAVAKVLEALGYEAAQIQPILKELQPVRGRMEVIAHAGFPTVVIDYAHTPDALEKALQALPNVTGSRWVVFGCGGERDRGKRPLMAKIAERYADHIILTTDNPRFEDPHAIFNDILAGFQAPQTVKVIADRAQAITFVLQQAQAGDVVLLAGKGHETAQCVRGEKIVCDERTIVAGVMKKGRRHVNSGRAGGSD